MNPNARHFATTYYLPTSQGGDVQRALCFTGRNGYLEHLLTNDRSVVGCSKCLERMPQQIQPSGERIVSRHPSYFAKSGSDWTEERKATAKRLWIEGHSAGEIAKTLGGVTRNAVIGMITRAGLKRPQAARDASISLGASLGRRTIAQRPRLVRVDPNPTPHPESRVFGETKVAKPSQRLALAGNGTVFEQAPRAIHKTAAGAWTALPGSTPVTIMGLGSFACKWPIDMPGAQEAHFCGNRTVATFCTAHAAIAYVPPPIKRASSVDSLVRLARRYA